MYIQLLWAFKFLVLTKFNFAGKGRGARKNDHQKQNKHVVLIYLSKCVFLDI